VTLVLAITVFAAHSIAQLRAGSHEIAPRRAHEAPQSAERFPTRSHTAHILPKVSVLMATENLSTVHCSAMRSGLGSRSDALKST